MKTRRLLVVSSFFSIIFAACSVQTEERLQPTPTSLPPSATPTPPATEIATPPPTPSTTPVPPSKTPTEVPPTLLVELDAVCRTGPGTNYPIVGYLSAGDGAAIDGVVEADPVWWFIQIDNGEKACWISDNVVAVAGSVAGVPHLTPPPTPTNEPISVPQGEGIYYFLVAVGTGGPFGCGDDLLYIYPGIERTGDLEVDITNALTALFANNYEYYNGLYNPMHASSLRVEDVEALPGESEINVTLRGDFARPKDRCDSQRMRDQVWETIELQFREVGHAVIRVHRALLGDLLVTGWK